MIADYSSSEQNEDDKLVGPVGASETVSAPKDIYRYKSVWPDSASCNWCHEVFSNREQIKKHMVHKHGRETMYKCKYCQYKVRLKIRLNRHVASVHNREAADYIDQSNKPMSRPPRNPVSHKSNSTRKCYFCFYETYKDLIRPHVLAVHKIKKKPHRCLYCNFVTNNLSELSTHLIEHDDMKKFSCPFCFYRTVRMDYLVRHMHVKHRSKVNSGQFKIDDEIMENLNKTVNRNHGNDSGDSDEEQEVFMCDQCPYSSPNQGSLNKHIVRVHQKHWSVEKVKKEEPEDSNSSDVQSESSQVTSEKKRFLCSKCDYVTIHESLYNEHIACNHIKTPTVVWYNCDYCSFTSVYMHSLKRHYEWVHIKTRRRRTDLPEGPKVRTFECDFCAKNYPKKVSLRRHIYKDHDEDKPFNCTICDYKTAVRAELTRHMRLHHFHHP